MVTPRCAVSVWWALGSLAISAGCGDDEPRQLTDANTQDAAEDAASDAHVDAAEPSDGSLPDSMRPWWQFDAQGLPDLPTDGCLQSVSAECDGPEDCSEGKICCAQLDSFLEGYRDIACTDADSCNLQEGGFALCHPNSANFPCSADGSLECRRSVILPHDFIGICAPKVGFAPDDLRGESRSDVVECGDSRCEVGSEKCCMTVSLDTVSFQSLARSAQCVPIETECDCQLPEPPPVDAGHDATPPLVDAMTDGAMMGDAMSIDDDAGP